MQVIFCVFFSIFIASPMQLLRCSIFHCYTGIIRTTQLARAFTNSKVSSILFVWILQKQKNFLRTICTQHFQPQLKMGILGYQISILHMIAATISTGTRPKIRNILI